MDVLIFVLVSLVPLLVFGLLVQRAWYRHVVAAHKRELARERGELWPPMPDGCEPPEPPPRPAA